MNTTSYSKKPASWDEVLKTVARTPAGRTLLERFLPLYTGKRVTLEAYPAALVTRLREILPEGQPIGAAFVHDGRTGTIYLDENAPLGALAPFLVHEITHALSRKVWDGSANRDPKVKAAVELEAFETQFRFTDELKNRDPQYQEFMKGYLPQARILHQKFSLQDIEELYCPDLRKLA